MKSRRVFSTDLPLLAQFDGLSCGVITHSSHKHKISKRREHHVSLSIKTRHNSGEFNWCPSCGEEYSELIFFEGFAGLTSHLAQHHEAPDLSCWLSLELSNQIPTAKTVHNRRKRSMCTSSV